MKYVATPPHPYRDVAELASDRESAALAMLVVRARRARRLVGIPVLAAASIAAFIGYRLLGGLLFAAIEERAPYITVLVTAFPIFVLGQALAAYAGRRAVLARSKAWIAEMRSAREVSPALLDAFVRLL